MKQKTNNILAKIFGKLIAWLITLSVFLVTLGLFLGLIALIKWLGMFVFGGA